MGLPATSESERVKADMPVLPKITPEPLTERGKSPVGLDGVVSRYTDRGINVPR